MKYNILRVVATCAGEKSNCTIVTIEFRNQ